MKSAHCCKTKNGICAHEKRAKKLDLAKVVLTIVGAGGFIAIGIVAPNALQLLAPVTTKRKRPLHNSDISKTIKRLYANGYIYIKNIKGEEKIGLTESGRKVLDRKNALEVTFKIPNKWDGKWRIILFDVPEKRGGRRTLQLLLKELGCKQLQKSVYVYPYDCFDEIDKVRSYYKLGKCVQYMVVEKIENEAELRSYFKIKKR